MTDLPDIDDRDAYVASVTEDFLLGGRVRLFQPRQGYRAATDPVLLAAACPARSGDSVLDLGCGVGAAALCLAARVDDLSLTGIELQAHYLDLALRNAQSNGRRFKGVSGDIRKPPEALKALTFDHVIANPPFHSRSSALPSPSPERDAANREGEAVVADWVDAGLRRLRQGGSLTLIYRAERLPDILAALSPRAGDITVLPLQSRQGRPAKRVVVRACKDRKGPFRLAAPLTVHEGSRHETDGDDFTDAAKAYLRDAAALEF